jgi:hypothetical protein
MDGKTGQRREYAESGIRRWIVIDIDHAALSDTSTTAGTYGIPPKRSAS